MLSGDKPLTQSFIDTFLKELGKELEGVEYSPEVTLATVVALQSEIDILKRIIVGLIEEKFASNDQSPLANFYST